ncbi:hypothetical protein [Burkholderia cepacia]|uniref:hypothetical protein n=1 Tax=Burkholderia cepacia TaxID=292 RepID=UPI002FDFD327
MNSVLRCTNNKARIRSIRVFIARACAGVLYAATVLGPGLISVPAVEMFFSVTLVMPFVGMLIYPRSARPVPVACLARSDVAIQTLFIATLKNWATFTLWPLAVTRAVIRAIRFGNGAIMEAVNLYALAFTYIFAFLLLANAIPAEVRARILLAFAIYLAIGMAALSAANVRFPSGPDLATEHFLAGLIFAAKRIRDAIVWPCLVLTAIRKRGKE